MKSWLPSRLCPTCNVAVKDEDCDFLKNRKAAEKAAIREIAGEQTRLSCAWATETALEGVGNREHRLHGKDRDLAGLLNPT